jgi:GTP-binding protein
VVFTIRRNLRTLVHLRYQKVFRAENGRDGEGRARYGRDGEDITVPVPPGTVLRDAETDDLIRDFGKDGDDFVFLKGGNGGWGNIHFKSSVNQAPRRALPGQESASRLLRVELRIIADIGLVGFPNAGKSSLLDRFTAARPKIAPYPFTTKIPNLGVLTIRGGASGGGFRDDRDIIIADIPGLIEGASEGAGLGFQFLRHISRTAALAFLIDLSSDTYLSAFDALAAELEAYSPDMMRKKRLFIGTKLDLEGTHERLEELRARYPTEEALGISVFSGEGITGLAQALARLVTTNEKHGEELP